ncbi:hypothetical protein AKJ65_01290 [candidate division MSBL1 archaeon SCGC-AAA259E19]|uniref:Uncharacterized protein n=1 Tax=candidate division MSBL1 archaeon SCGC-AAA259E19 TaxID=1698264 RepID=A0A133UN79_9EURY|nr:hypothetical protein AKJ65_01290 [candidate division MSBL1 archaeon SCGC-AAA259E19]
MVSKRLDETAKLWLKKGLKERKSRKKMSGGLSDEKAEKVTEEILEANRRANRETWKEKNIGILLIATGVTVIVDQLVMGFLPLYWAIPFLASGIPIAVYAFLENTRKFREYAEEDVEEVRRNEGS